MQVFRGSGAPFRGSGAWAQNQLCQDLKTSSLDVGHRHAQTVMTVLLVHSTSFNCFLRHDNDVEKVIGRIARAGYEFWAAEEDLENILDDVP